MSPRLARAPRPGGSRPPEATLGRPTCASRFNVGVLRSGSAPPLRGLPPVVPGASRRARRLPPCSDGTRCRSWRGRLAARTPEHTPARRETDLLSRVPGGAAEPGPGPEPAHLRRARKPAHSGGDPGGRARPPRRPPAGACGPQPCRPRVCGAWPNGHRVNGRLLRRALSGGTGDHSAYNLSGRGRRRWSAGARRRGVLRLPLRVAGGGSGRAGRPIAERRSAAGPAFRRRRETSAGRWSSVGQRRGRQAAEQAEVAGPRPRAVRRRRDPVPGEGPVPITPSRSSCGAASSSRWVPGVLFGARSTWGWGRCRCPRCAVGGVGGGGREAARPAPRHGDAQVRGTVCTGAGGTQVREPPLQRPACRTAGTWRPARSPPSSPGPAR